MNDGRFSVTTETGGISWSYWLNCRIDAVGKQLSKVKM
jgi:hypothetical protein